MDLCFHKVQRHWRDRDQALDARLWPFLDNILLARKEVFQEFSEFRFRLDNQLFRPTDYDSQEILFEQRHLKLRVGLSMQGEHLPRILELKTPQVVVAFCKTLRFGEFTG